MGYFYWLRVKNANHPHTELSLGYFEDAKFYLESSVASFNPFLIAWLREYCTFSESFVVTLKCFLDQNTPSWELFSKKIVVFH